jgi:L-lactate dehydrogenase complex protein LldG
MTTRKLFVNAISKSLGRAGPPQTVPRFTWRHSVQKDVMKDKSQDELARAFVEYSNKIGIDASETTRDRLNESIRIAVRECGSGPIILTNDPLLRDLCTADALGENWKVHVWNAGESRERNLRFAEKAATGIAVVKMALAESATVLLFSHKGCGRSVTLLPQSVIYIIPKSCIRSRLTQGMEFLRRYKEDLPSSVNFVSGPSATSDIELVRVVGVHGPMHVVHIVVNDI